MFKHELQTAGGREHDCKLFDPPAAQRPEGATQLWHMAAYEMGLQWAMGGAAHISSDSDVVASCKKLGRSEHASASVGPA